MFRGRRRSRDTDGVKFAHPIEHFVFLTVGQTLTYKHRPVNGRQTVKLGRPFSQVGHEPLKVANVLLE